MQKIIKQYIENITNPLFYYIDKDGNSVFRNFCMFKNSGNCYNKIIQLKDAGKIIEYRIDLDKKFTLYNIIIAFFLYFLFLHTICNFSGLLLYEIIFIILFFSARMLAGKKFENILTKTFGEYSICEFRPNVTPEKKKSFKRNYLYKISTIIIVIFGFWGLSAGMQSLIKHYANQQNPNYKKAIAISNIYTLLYPKTSIIYEVKTFKNYIDGEFDQAVKNYTTALDMKGKNITDKDYIRFANLLYLVKKSDGSQSAIDIYNEYTTKKKTSTEQQTKLLWIKSMFSIANGLTEFIDIDYDNLLESATNEYRKFYILNDKAYMLYLKKDYKEAIKIYNTIIPYCATKQNLKKEQARLYIERGYAKKHVGDNIGANSDFIASKVNLYDVQKYEPKLMVPEFMLYKI